MTQVRTRRSKTTAEKINPDEVFKQHIVLKSEAATIVSRSEKLKKRLKDWLSVAGKSLTYQNDNGSIFYDFADTVEDGHGGKFSGMELRKSQPDPVFNEETAEKILEEKGILKEALSYYVDQDKVYLLVQEGKLTEDELDEMMDPKDPTWSFWPVKGEV